MVDIDRCVNCGEYVPEGRMICVDCASSFVSAGSTVSYIDPVLFTLWGWKVYQKNKVGFYAIKEGETVELEGNNLDSLMELIIMREGKCDL